MTPEQENVRELVRKIKMLRTDPHILDMRDLDLVTIDDFSNRLDDMIHLNFMNEKNKEIILKNGLTLRMLLKGSKCKCGMELTVNFDKRGNDTQFIFDQPELNSVEEDFLILMDENSHGEDALFKAL
jgi:hypothetical protein